MLKTWFRNDLMGVPGDEDGGGLTSFVVFSSLGFFPLTPGRAEYSIVRPLFERAKIHVGNGKTFEVKANNVSDDNKYIQCATLNGKPLTDKEIAYMKKYLKKPSKSTIDYVTIGIKNIYKIVADKETYFIDIQD